MNKNWYTLSQLFEEVGKFPFKVRHKTESDNPRIIHGKTKFGFWIMEYGQETLKKEWGDIEEFRLVE